MLSACRVRVPNTGQVVDVTLPVGTRRPEVSDHMEQMHNYDAQHDPIMVPVPSGDFTFHFEVKDGVTQVEIRHFCVLPAGIQHPDPASIIDVFPLGGSYQGYEQKVPVGE